jgi:hypothetical protein
MSARSFGTINNDNAKRRTFSCRPQRSEAKEFRGVAGGIAMGFVDFARNNSFKDRRDVIMDGQRRQLSGRREEFQ